MAVFTHKEYSKKNTPNTLKNDEGVFENTVLPEEKLPLKKEVSLYWLKHPEIPKNGPLPNFEDTLTIEGKEFRRICNNGIIKTYEKPLIDFLKKKGYLVMNKEKIIVEV